MRILDSVPENLLHKLVLVEDGGKFAICHQSHGRRPETVHCTLSEQAVLDQWNENVFRMFLSVTHNPHDSQALAERRIATIL